MNFTFGIITNNTNSENIKNILNSIYKQNIPVFEIIIIGGLYTEFLKEQKNVVHIAFNEKIKDKWITKKKNIITENSKYENVVYMHDYICLCDNWYIEFLKYGDDFKCVNNVILNYDGSRFRDLCLIPNWLKDFKNRFPTDLKTDYLLPYGLENNFNKWIYFSGTFFIAKKSIMEEIRFDENLTWGHGEDIVWAGEYSAKYDFSFNSNSKCRLLKQKDVIFSELKREKALELIKKMNL